MLKVKTLALQALMAVAVVAAGCDVTINDGDGTGEGEGEGEGEDITLLGPDESCNLTRTDEICDTAQDLVCVQQGLNPNAGVCRPTCGDLATGVDPAITCPSGTACQVFFDPALEPTAVVCAPQGERNGACRALLDENACLEGDCVPLAITFDDAGALETVDALGCRTPCSQDTECATGESCIQGGRFGFQFDFEAEQANGANVTCTQAVCDAGTAGCECNAEAGFECITFGEDAPTCFRLLGMCAAAVAPITTPGIAGIEDLTVAETDVCNQVDGAPRLCDADSFYGDIENPGSSECITNQFFQNPNDGVCFAFCASPSIDRNNNNVIDTGEEGETNSCPAGFECTGDMGRAFLLAGAVSDPAGPFEVKACNPTACTAGQPCPAQCGPGDTECISFESTQGDVSLCLAPFKNCTDAPAANVAPVFTSLATGAVAENAPIATAIYTATATDANAGDTIVFTVKPAVGDAALVTMTNGVVTLLASANHEVKPTYSFTVVATDSATPALSTELAVVISVTDVNEAPAFGAETGVGTVIENAAITTAIFTAAAVDGDTGATITYSIKQGVSPADDAALVAIDGATGVVTLLASANFESTQLTYVFTVVATDNGALTDEQVVTVTVTNDVADDG